MVDTFHTDLEIKNVFTKYLKESCLLCSDQQSSFKYVSNEYFEEIARLLLAVVSINGLILFRP